MDTIKMTQEQVSAFADGELSASQSEAALANLRAPQGRADWDLYHQIGDVLRSEETSGGLSAGFAARMAARLEAEPTIMAPVIDVAQERSQQKNIAHGLSSVRRFAMPGVVAAAIAAVALLGGPQLMVAMNGAPAKTHLTPEPSQAMVASASHTVSHASVIAASAPIERAVAVPSQPAQPASGGKEVMLRDEGMDEYLMAHQRFSPSVYSTAQFARSATFAEDSGK
ncbi:MAG: histidine kinase [Herminiimonas sp.]|nr:histidine kinase [Herminiimonas sp.]